MAAPIITSALDPNIDEALSELADSLCSAQSTGEAFRSEHPGLTDATALVQLGQSAQEVVRAREEAERLNAAKLRDMLADERDHAIDIVDHAAQRAEDELRATHPGDRVLLALLDTATASRHLAAAGRRRAAADRREAAADRAAAAADRLQARIDVQRAQLDGLTGVYTRNLGRVTLQHEIDRARRSNEPFVLAFVDVDGLKRFNDVEGHAAGDALLRSVVRALRANLRTYDPIVRVGGDEFLCGFGRTQLPAAQKRVSEIRSAVEHGPPPGSISVGLAELREGDSLDALVTRADTAMYATRAAVRRRQ